MKWFLLSLPVLVLVTSGCVIPGTNINIPFLSEIIGGQTTVEQTGDVIKIDSFTVDPSPTLRSGQQVSLTAVVKNLQSADSKPQKGVQVWLYNDCNIFEVSRATCTGGVNQPEEKTIADHRKCNLGTMYPQSTGVVKWMLTAKDVNVQTRCKIGVLVKYDYTTYSSSGITWVNQQEYNNLISQGKTFSEKGTLVLGEGPVKAYLEVPNQPILFNPAQIQDNGNQYETGVGSLNFHLANRGGGRVESPVAGNGNIEFCAQSKCSLCTEDHKPGKIRLCFYTGTDDGKNEIVYLHKETPSSEKPAEKSIADCIMGNTGNSANKDKPDESKIYELPFLKGDTSRVSCPIWNTDFTQKENMPKTSSTYFLNARIDYTYIFESSVDLTIDPKITL